jgi:hypothetical protein
MAAAVTTTVQTPDVHPVTGLPVQNVAVFSVGDLVTEAFMSDGTPGVVVAIEGKGKTVYVRPVNFIVGNATEQSFANYYDDTTIVVDPASVEAAVALGKGEGARKYVLRINNHARYTNGREQDQYGSREMHSAKWAIPGSSAGSIWAGAKFRRDPHV